MYARGVSERRAQVSIADAVKREPENLAFADRTWSRLTSRAPRRVRVAADAGLRLGELLALRWSDVDWAGSALMISRAVFAGQ